MKNPRPDGKKNVNMVIDPDLWKKAKQKAIELDQDLADFVAEAIKEKLNGKGVIKG